MKRIALCVVFAYCFCHVAWSQERVNPVVSDFGGIYEIENATFQADPRIEYKIVVDVYSGEDDMNQINSALNNVARMLNLHSVAGADISRMKVVLAIHASATYAILSDNAYRKRYSCSNPNIALINALADAGVKLTVCGQSLIARGVDADELLNPVEVATSMLTTVTTLQLNGYAFLRF